MVQVDPEKNIQHDKIFFKKINIKKKNSNKWQNQKKTDRSFLLAE